MEFRDVLLSRKSCREYVDMKVEKEKLDQVVTSGSLAPLGMPRMGKPHLTVITDPGTLKALGYISGPDRDAIYGAPALIVVSCPDVPRPGLSRMNAACVVEMMSLAATDLGLANIYLYGVTMGLSKNEEMMKKIGIPEGYIPLSRLALGYSKEGVAQCKEFAEVLEKNEIL